MPEKSRGEEMLTKRSDNQKLGAAALIALRADRGSLYIHILNYQLTHAYLATSISEKSETCFCRSHYVRENEVVLSMKCQELVPKDKICK